MIHELKTLPEYFEAAQKREKNFEVRKDDRPFEVGDFLALNEWSEDLGYTGRCMLFEITYILDNPDYCKDGYVILGIAPRRIAGASALTDQSAQCVSVYGRKGDTDGVCWQGKAGTAQGDLCRTVRNLS